ncbi:MAG: PilZ domain-containing protein [Xanthobacteraceae bacterium]
MPLGDAKTERRSCQHNRTFKAGKIVISAKAPKVDCVVRNLSTDGARLKVSATFGLPARFELLLESKSYSCRIVWVTETEMRVTFA